jgi:hypothetical protein
LGKESRPDKDQLMQFIISSKLASNSSPSLKYSTTIFLHYSMADNCDEGNLSTVRSKIVGIAESMGMASCSIVSTRMDPVVTWTPPGYQSAAMVGGGNLEEKVVELDHEMAG